MRIETVQLPDTFIRDDSSVSRSGRRTFLLGLSLCRTERLESQSGQNCGQVALEQPVSLAARVHGRQRTAVRVAATSKTQLAGSCQCPPDGIGVHSTSALRSTWLSLWGRSLECEKNQTAGFRKHHYAPRKTPTN